MSASMSASVNSAHSPLPAPAGAAEPSTCRLCAGEARVLFVRRHVDGDSIRYERCTRCGSLQTQAPYWLDAVYAKSDAPDLDTFAGERVLRDRALALLLFRLCGLDPRVDRLLDWGGGTGLLVRLLRDAGIDAYHHDRYERNHFASGFDFDPRARYRFVTAFEVWEHFAYPAAELERLFALAPDFVLVSTCPFTGQGPDWDYLGPAKSQHVFFYSAAALQRIAAARDYRFAPLGPAYWFFARPRVAARTLAVLSRLAHRPRLLELAFLLARRGSRAPSDHAAIRALLDTADRCRAEPLHR